MSGHFNKTSPNAFGGAFGFDANTGGGITLHKHQASIPAGGWNMGDALSSPQGEWDDVLDELDDEDIHDEIERNAHTQYKMHPTDVFSKNKTDKNSLGGLHVSIASVIGVSESKVDLPEKIIESYVKEVLLELGISGNIAVQSKARAKNTGGHYDKVYHLDTNDLGSMGMTNGAYIGTKNRIYRQSNKATDSGDETIEGKFGKTKKQYVDDLESFEDGQSTSEIYCQNYDDEYIDDINIFRFK
tara:strand:- start:12290 stop:13018 length:729 start_codon:yes stop_codon:yes gene_type:complete